MIGYEMQKMNSVFILIEAIKGVSRIKRVMKVKGGTWISEKEIWWEPVNVKRFRPEGD